MPQGSCCEWVTSLDAFALLCRANAATRKPSIPFLLFGGGLLGEPRMSVSTRISIAWPPDIPPKEETDTLVLSFPNDHFIDLRPLKSYDALDWGMAGYQRSAETPEGRKSIYSSLLILRLI